MPSDKGIAHALLHGVDVAALRRDPRWRPAEFAFWVLPVLAYFVFPDNLSLLSQIAITGLFALSLDLILGYAGIVSLGHAAFFGLGAYAAGLLATHGYGDPLLGLGAAIVLSACAGFATSFLVLRGADLTRLMVTLGVSLMLYEAANKLTPITGGLDGLQGVEIKPVLGLFAFDMVGRTAYIYCVVILFVLFWIARHLVHAPEPRTVNEEIACGDAILWPSDRCMAGHGTGRQQLRRARRGEIAPSRARRIRDAGIFTDQPLLED